MSERMGTATLGLRGRWSWALGGAIGGVVGSLLFGIVLWLADPAIITETIPAMYGLDVGPVGWGFHLLHGLILGVIFGFLVTRAPVLGTLGADVQTPAIESMGLNLRFALAGLVYGLAVWAILPLMVATALAVIGGDDAAGFPALAPVSLVGHLLYGLLLGALFSLFVDIDAATTEQDAPFEEGPEDSRRD